MYVRERHWLSDSFKSTSSTIGNHVDSLPRLETKQHPFDSYSNLSYYPAINN